MPTFAVYYIPQADDPFYQLGTRILGYDVRAHQAVIAPSEREEMLGSNGETWTMISRPYGFHMTICEAFDCHWTAVPRVEQELADLLQCFDPSHPLVLQQKGDYPIGIWGEEGNHSMVLLSEPNTLLRVIHTRLVARLTPFGIGPGCLKNYLRSPEKELPPHLRQQIRLFSSPTVFENWHPHFTLLNPYTGKEAIVMASRFTQFFQAYSQITRQTICLLIQDDNETNWQISHEFSR